MTSNPSTKPGQESLLLNIGLNILLPSLILMKSDRWLDLEPTAGLLLALLFPVGYGLYDFAARRRYNLFSIVGFVSILITGGVGLLRIDKDWIAIKEAAVPSLFGLAVLATLKTRRPLVHLFLFNDQIIDVQKVEAALAQRNSRLDFERLLAFSTALVAGSFLLSAVLNFLLARFLIKSESGTVSFNEELGQLTFWSYPVIALPCAIVMAIALFLVLRGIRKLTDLELEEVFRGR